MAWSEGFEPQVSDRCKVIVLGSMPGIKSLAENEYYAHPRNGFWLIMQHLFNIDKDLPYISRVHELNRKGVGLWDVYHKCFRKGSLDSAIKKTSAELNDFRALFAQYPSIEHVFFNGEAAASAFKKYVRTQFEVVEGSESLPLPCLYTLTRKEVACDAIDAHTIACYKLPSTSPANAATSITQKIEAWRKVEEVLLWQ